MQKQSDFDIRKYLNIVDKYKWHGLIPACVIMLILTFASSFLPKVYESRCVVEVETGSIENPLRNQRVNLPPLGAHLSVFSETARSWDILSSVVDEVGAEAIITNNDLYNLDKIKKKLMLRGKAGNKAPAQSIEKESVAAILRRGLGFRQRPPRFLAISCRGVNPDVTADILNTLISKLIEEQTASQLNRAGRSYKFVKTEMENYKDKLEEAEAKLKEFKENHISELPNNMNMNLAQLTSDKSEILSLGLELREQKITSDYISEQMESQKTLIVSEIRTEANPLLGVLNERIVDMEIELTRLRTNYTDLHPRVAELRGQLEDLKKQREGLQESTINSETSMLNPVYQQLARAKQETMVRMEIIRNRIAELEKRMAENEKKVQSMPAQEQELLRLNRNYDVTANIYEMFLQKLEEVRLQEKLATEENNKQSFRVFEYARAMTTPVAPNKLRLLMLIGVIGGGIFIGIILLFDHFDDSFKTVEEVKEYLQKPLLGSFPNLTVESGNGSHAKRDKKSSAAVGKS